MFLKPGSLPSAPHTAAAAARAITSTEAQRLNAATLAEHRGDAETTFIAHDTVFASSLPLAQQRERLPIRQHRTALLYAIETHQVLIVVGQTGCGKTTQLPQYLYEAGWAGAKRKRCIACTQPRRVAVTSISARVAQEMNVTLGEEVGYSVRFDDCYSPDKTVLKYMTDGMLFREMMQDPLLSAYSVIMVDEAHERGMYTDLLLGLLRKIVKRRQDLRVVISSATIDADLFKGFFEAVCGPEQVTVMSLEGRMFPVDHFYLQSPCDDYVAKSIQTVLAIHRSKEPGDILVFLTGREEIEQVASALKENKSTLLPLPLYAGMSLELQMHIFDPPPRGIRKCVISTNIAEASLTIDGIVHVVDCGFVKMKAYDPATGMDALMTTPISRASATQRSGRAGRVRDGRCYRLYTHDAFLHMREQEIPEIQRSNLCTMILQLKALGIDNVVKFDFVSPPPSQLMIRALDILYSLGALDDYARLTIPLGVQMAELPLEPMVAKILLEAKTRDCLAELLTIAALVSVPTVFHGNLDPSQSRFAVEEGDHMTFLNVFAAYQAHAHQPSWFSKAGLHHKNLVQAAAVRRQLTRYLRKFDIDVAEKATDKRLDRRAKSRQIRQCLTSGYFANAAIGRGDGSYQSLRDAKTTLYIHPNSVLFTRAPPCVIYHDIVSTSKHFMQHVTAIDIDWLHTVAPHYYELASKRK